jgi:hypothetical protein
MSAPAKSAAAAPKAPALKSAMKTPVKTPTVANGNGKAPAAKAPAAAGKSPVPKAGAKAPAVEVKPKKAVQRLANLLDMHIPPARVRTAFEEYGLNYAHTVKLVPTEKAIRQLRVQGHPQPEPTTPVRLPATATPAERAAHKVARAKYEKDHQTWGEWKSPEYTASETVALLVVALRKVIKIHTRKVPENQTAEQAAKRQVKDTQNIEDLIQVLQHDKPPKAMKNIAKFVPRGFSEYVGDLDLNDPDAIEAKIIELQEADVNAQHFIEMYAVRKQKIRVTQASVVAAAAVVQHLVQDLAGHACGNGVAKEKKLITAEYCLAVNSMTGDYRKLSTYGLFKDLPIVRDLEAKQARQARWRRQAYDAKRQQTQLYHKRVARLEADHKARNLPAKDFKAPEFEFRYTSFAESEVSGGFAVREEHRGEDGQVKLHKRTQKELVVYRWNKLDAPKERDPTRVSFEASIAEVCQEVAEDIAAMGESGIEGLRITRNLLYFLDTVCHQFLDSMAAALQEMLKMTQTRTVDASMVMTMVTTALQRTCDMPHGQFTPGVEHRNLLKYISEKVSEIESYRTATSLAKKGLASSSEVDIRPQAVEPDVVADEPEEAEDDGAPVEDDDDVADVATPAPAAAKGKAPAKAPAKVLEENGEEYADNALEESDEPAPVKKPAPAAAKGKAPAKQP